MEVGEGGGGKKEKKSSARQIQTITLKFGRDQELILEVTSGQDNEALD